MMNYLPYVCDIKVRLTNSLIYQKKKFEFSTGINKWQLLPSIDFQQFRYQTSHAPDVLQC
jgi:hypothetical protein